MLLDTRAVTVQIGAVLLLGILVIGLTTYQATIVPADNRAAEFEHSQNVLDEMQTLKSNYENSVATGDDSTSTVTLGTRYPRRLIAINPPPASGTLSTTAAGTISSDQLDIDALSEQNGTTRRLQYEPRYFEYQSPPTITYDGIVLYSTFDDEYIIESEQSLISGEQLTLAPLEGNISKTGIGRVGVRFRAGVRESTEQTVADEMRLTIPSEIPNETWETNSKLLADELVEEGGQVDRVENNETANGVDIYLTNGTYQLQYRTVGATDVPSSGPATDRSERSGNESAGESSVGQSGESDFSDTQSETISTSGGIWKGVSNVDSITLTNPRFSPFDMEGDLEKDERYFRLAMVIGTGPSSDPEYMIILGGGDGMSYDVEDGEFDDDQDAYIYEFEGGEEIFGTEESLDKDALNEWLGGTPLDVLDETNYADPDEVDEELDDIRDYITDNEVEIYITDMHGRVDVALE